MPSPDVVVVESPAKAKTINKYLGSGYVVLASYGHVRDLPEKDGSVRPEQDFDMLYAVEPDSQKHLRLIAKAAKEARRLYLATDPDREGEAISWHVLQALRAEHRLTDLEVKRVAFNAITKKAVLDAIAHPRELDLDLVNAQQARRALDYLVGFTLSPVLWRKLPGARSAGRVQSVALRLVCEREMEIEAFRPEEYWSVDVDLTTPRGEPLAARLVSLDGRKLEKFSLPDEATAQRAFAAVAARAFQVKDVETRPQRRNPPPPFTTSTMQQEASRKLGFAAKRTMQIAQRLYEGIELGGETVGLITYMRTDGVQIAEEAVADCRRVIQQRFGRPYLPAEPRRYQARTLNAQEAHEAIRPTDPAREPDTVERFLDADQRRLYELIWKRTMASQMESARLSRTAVEIASPDGRVGLRATGAVLEFPGFLALYQEGRDDRTGREEEDDDERRLPRVQAGEALARAAIRPEQHFTEPPPRYAEATLVKKLEELGIGRPSTYASILSVLQDRSYVRLEKNRFVPDAKGRLVTAFLVGFFERYFAYDFTAKLEEQLDEIAERRADWKAVLREFWLAFSRRAEPGEAGVVLASVADAIAHLDRAIGKRGEVLSAIDQALGPHYFPPRADGRDARQCPACSDGRLAIRFGRNGGFIGCSRYPDCRYTRPLIGGEGEEAAEEGPRDLGIDPPSGLAVSLRKGPFGLYLQLGEARGGEKPRRVTLPRDVRAEEIALDLALALLRLPRQLGAHPEDGKPILAGIGRFGPYLQHEKKYARLSGTEEVLSIGLNRAVDLLAQPRRPGRGERPAATPLRELGAHPEDGAPVRLFSGRYGPYVKHGAVNATLPKTTPPESLTLEQAVALLAERQAAGGKKPRRAGRRATPTAESRAKPAADKAAKRPRKRVGNGRPATRAKTAAGD
ncbi:MAG: type I DNA topoisomerase [Alphaproteobacteria bacterium]|nr:type I DNA topoisomerase [Alphaproteobacteria bacterium]